MSARSHAARRPAPARARRRVVPRRGGSRVNWQRVGRVALTVVLFAVLISYLNPLVNFVDAWRDSNANEEHLAELKREHRALEQRAAEAVTQPVIEREARKLGYVRPDERAYVVRGLPD